MINQNTQYNKIPEYPEHSNYLSPKQIFQNLENSGNEINPYADDICQQYIPTQHNTNCLSLKQRLLEILENSCDEIERNPYAYDICQQHGIQTQCNEKTSLRYWIQRTANKDNSRKLQEIEQRFFHVNLCI